MEKGLKKENERVLPEHHFRISASVIKQLGEELITDEVTALMELVKNAYDADTKDIKITIATKAKLGEEYFFKNDTGYVLIQDFGAGMSSSNITDNWLVISKSAKRTMKAEGGETDGGRIPLGDKGLGRLSTQKIAHNIELITKVSGQFEADHVAFSWDSFHSDLMVDEVEIKRFKTPKKKQDKGTTVILSKLKNPEIWTGSSRDRFRGQLSQLLYPEPKDRPVSITLSIDGEGQNFDELNSQVKKASACNYKFEYDWNKGEPLLRIEGTVSLRKMRSGNSQSAKSEYAKLIEVDKGKDFFNFLIDKNANRSEFLTDLVYKGTKNSFFEFTREIPLRDLENIEVKKAIGHKPKKKNDGEEESVVIASPGNFSGELYDIPKDELTSDLKKYVDNLVGVRVYKDGFGIKPYGFAKNDWLELGQTWSSGSSYYGLKPGGTIGFVSLTLKENFSLIEKTDREGFISSPYSRNFVTLMRNVLIIEVNTIVERTRRSFNQYRKKSYARSTEEVLSHRHSTQRIITTANRAKSIAQESGQLTKKLNDISDDVFALTSKKHASFDSDTIKKLTSLKSIITESTNYLTKANGLLSEVMTLENDAEFLDPYIDDIEERIAQFSELAGLGLTAEALTHELFHMLDRANVHLNELVKQIKKKDFQNPFDHTEGLNSFLKSLRIQVNHLSPVLKYNRERKEHINMKEFLTEGAAFFQSRVSSIPVTIETSRGFTVKMNRGKLTQVFDNLLFNSEYWLKERRIHEPKFKPQITIGIDLPYVTIKDNEHGLDKGVVDRLFQPFVTTKPKGIGRGLGLFITKNIVENNDCDIVLLPDKNKNGNRHIFQIDFTSIIS